MQIKPAEGVEAARLGSVRPASVGQLTSDAQTRSTSVSLSSAARAYATALTDALPLAEALRLYDILTDDDRAVLAWAAEFAHVQGIDLGEVRRLVVDLFAYRAKRVAEREPQRADAGVTAPMAEDLPASEGEPLARPHAGQAPLVLPTFTPRDEALARTILASLAIRDTLLDRGFVRALLEPDLHPAHTVDFEFLSRIVVALSPTRSEALDATVSFASREARSELARALDALNIAAADLAAVLPAVVRDGPALLRRRLLDLEPGQTGAAPASASWRTLLQLTRNDRAVLSLLYVGARERGAEMNAVDDFARALLALRAAERAEAASLRGRPPPGDPAGGQGARPPESAAPRLPRAAADVAPSLLQAAGPAPSSPRLAEEAAPARPLADAAPHELADAVAFSTRAQGGRPAPSEELSERTVPSVARGYGSATQLAARASGSYRSLTRLDARLGPNLNTDAPVSHGAGALALPWHGQAGAFQSSIPASARPFDIAQAMGLSALVGQLHARSLRARRPRLSNQRDGIRAIDGLREVVRETDADRTNEDGSSRRRRALWQALLQRRRRARARAR